LDNKVLETKTLSEMTLEMNPIDLRMTFT